MDIASIGLVQFSRLCEKYDPDARAAFTLCKGGIKNMKVRVLL